MPHFFASDLMAIALAFLLGLPVVVIPGYAFGWWLNLLGFRREPPATRWAWALAFGLTIEPIFLYLPFRLFSVGAMWAVFAALLLAGLVAVFRRDALPHWRDIPHAAKIATVVALLLGCFLMLDVVVGSRVYPPSEIVDTSFRSQVITSVATSDHLPPRSMFFNPGHPTPLGYHYVFFLLSGLMMRLGFGLVTARMALVAVALWVSLAMLVVVAISIRFFGTSTDRPRATRIAWFLLLVGGLDILPVGSEILTRWITGHPHIIPYADIEFWNGWGMAFGWISTLVWSPHHLAGLMACVLGCLFLWNSREERGAQRWLAAIGAALAFASAAGTSIYVTAIFAVLLLLVAIELLLNAPRYLPALAFSGAVALLLALPFLLDTRMAAGHGGASVFDFTARPFQPVILLFDHLQVKSPLAWNLAYLATLPLNYLLEFGVFFIAGIWWVYDRRRGHSLGLRDHLSGGLVAISLILPAIIWSGMEYSNDFGYRGVLPAQFIFLLWAAEFADRYWHDWTRWCPTFTRRWCPTSAAVSRCGTSTNPTLSRFLQIGLITVALGLGTTLLEVFLLRATIGNFEQGTVLPGQMLRPRHSADAFGDLRAAYTWLRNNTSPDTVVQENPVTWQLVAEGQYSQRPAAVYGSNPSFMVGVDHADYLQTLAAVKTLFAAGATSQTIASTCSNLRIGYLVVEDDDPVWSDRQSYVWTQPPAFTSSHVHIYRCGNL